MAITTTTVTVPSRYFPWRAPREEGRTDIPRGELLFSAVEQTITAGGVGNEQQLFVAINFPVNFAFAISEFRVAIDSAAGNTNNFETMGACVVKGTSAATGLYEYWAKMNAVAAAGGTFDAATFQEAMIYDLGEDAPKMMIKADEANQNGQIRAWFRNLTQNDAAYEANIFCRCLVYDVSQAYDWRSNSPILTR